VVLHGVHIETVLVVASGVVLDDTNDFGAVLLEELGSPVADSTESLNDDGFICYTHISEFGLFDKGFDFEELLDTVVHTETSGLGTAFNTTLRGELASAATFSVDVTLTVHVDIGILDPSHNLLVSSKIGTEAIDLGSNEALLGQLHSVSPGDSLDLVLGVLLGVNLDTTLGTAEGNVSDGELESHQGGESHNFLQINIVGISSATLNGELVMLVLSAVADDVLHGAVVSADWDGKTDNVVAHLDDIEVILGNAGLGSGTVKEQLNILEETRLFSGNTLDLLDSEGTETVLGEANSGLLGGISVKSFV